jgi:hypothetical protein
MKKWLFNPFIYVAGMRSLLIGWVIMLITAAIGYVSKMHFDGAIDMHTGQAPPSSYFISVLEMFIDWVCLVLPLYIFGRIASESSIRFIDVAGTLALAKWPMIFMTLLGFLPLPQLDEKTANFKDMLAFATNPTVITEALISLPIIIWIIVLMYNAFAVSTNLKGGKAATAFIAGVIIAEVISKVILKFLL